MSLFPYNTNFIMIFIYFDLRNEVFIPGERIFWLYYIFYGLFTRHEDFFRKWKLKFEITWQNIGILSFLSRAKK